MAREKNSEYSQIERRREERHEIKTAWKRGQLLMFALVGVVVSALVLPTHGGNEFFAHIGDYFLKNPAALFGKELDYFNRSAYLAGGAVAAFVAWSFFKAKSALELQDEIGWRVQKRLKVPATLRYKLRVAEWLETATYWLYYPLSMILISVNQPWDKEKLYFRHAYASHIDYSYFRPRITVKDGYKRAERLSLLSEAYGLFSSKGKNGGRMTDPDYLDFISLWEEGEKSFTDLLRIAEGYIALHGEEKFDKVISEDEAKEMIGSRGLDGIRMYDGRDEVAFSWKIINSLIDEETRRYRKFLDKFAIVKADGALTFSRVFRRNYDLLAYDADTLRTFAEMPSGRWRDIGSPGSVNSERLVSAVSSFLVMEFRLVCLISVLRQYINLPAGTVVVRLGNYATKMIVENFDVSNLIRIRKNINDGTSKSFPSDVLANLFLATWHYYNHTVENSFLERQERLFNFRLDEIDKAATGAAGADGMASAAQQTIAEFTMPPLETLDKETRERIEETVSFILSSEEASTEDE